MPITEDRRVQRTHRALLEAFKALVLERGYDEISVQDITDRADVGRATFYLHYKDKEDLLSDFMHNVIQEFLISSPQIMQDNWTLNQSDAVKHIFEFAADNFELFDKLTKSKGSFIALSHLQIGVKEIISANLSSEIQSKNLEPILPMNFIENFYAGALAALIFWWLENGMPYTPLETAEMYRQIILKGRRGILKPATKTN